MASNSNDQTVLFAHSGHSWQRTKFKLSQQYITLLLDN